MRAQADGNTYSGLIAVVGPCAAGKSCLVEGLRAYGYNAREVVQEHSYVPAMWQRITHPDLLIYLDVSWTVARGRRPRADVDDVPPLWWQEQGRRLAHARAHADLYIDTDPLSPQAVLAEAVAFLQARVSPRCGP